MESRIAASEVNTSGTEDVRILVLDDEQVVIEAIKKHLRDSGYKIYSAKNGKEGLRLYSEVKPMLVILDLKMPVMDGIEFLENLQLSPDDPASVIVLTGHGSDEDMQRCFDLGIGAFLHKPFNVYELKGLVKHSIALKQVGENLRCELLERTKMEDELRIYRYHLEELVHKRTAELELSNEQLQVEIVQRKKAEEKISLSLREKEVLLKEIHHRVKNNLQIVSSLLDLQSKYINSTELLDMFKDSQNRLKTMALIHEKLYQSDDLSIINFSRYIPSLLNHLYQSYNLSTSVIFLDTDIEDISIGVDTAVPCGLIINELVSNSLKYAFKNGVDGILSVYLKRDEDDGFSLTIGDNGVGLPDGFDPKSVKSLGLRLVNALVVDQLEGSIDYEGDGGAKYLIKFKELKYDKRR
ncbi:histidine kinase dimerization/phosphoacceptor domain -containing protein [Candidatus Magnetomonas plexicatena]|uniref:histidine kinase dimerization/phosphoacceptor domain -containing protein n=1 Tax=Candidatus Magnetomonas plexicatena TaxID=2552947 RepID=UPI001C76AF79|nr:response regulator [Nitrospirales bacterium LBB_01]